MVLCNMSRWIYGLQQDMLQGLPSRCSISLYGNLL